MHWLNLTLLFLAQLISATGAIVLVTLGGIIGSYLVSNPAWATLSVSMTVVASALATIPAATLMHRIGRRKGFALGSLSAVIAALLAAWSLYHEHFPVFVISGFIFGINLAFTQHYRFAAAESVDKPFVPRAISMVLVGAIGGALVGPELITIGKDWVADVPYAGTMYALAVIYALQLLLFVFLEKSRAEASDDEVVPARQFAEIIRQPVFIVAVIGGVAGYGLMTFVMTATPLSMHVLQGHDIDVTKNVIRAHVLAMYIPSLVSGFLIERLGLVRMMVVGALALIATSVVGLQGHEVLHYWWALVLLGVGWNFLYVGATTMLTLTYTDAERFRVQGFNDFAVFGASATASLLAGTVLHFFGWEKLMWIPVPILVVVVAALLWVRKDALLKKGAA
ncbi:MAG: MFS transporter [Pseudomonadota bacterium]